MTSMRENLVTVAPEFGVTVTSESDDQLKIQLDLLLPSGTSHSYCLVIRDNGTIPVVFEDMPRQLPACCMERHINSDGSFCLSWAPGEPSAVNNEATARQFWARLTRFLQSQLSASKLRIWPGGQDARAHGDAALHQANAEQIASELGPTVATDLKNGLLVVRADQKKHGSTRLELMRGEKRVARIHTRTRALVTERVQCLCDASQATQAPIETCGDHAQRIALLTWAIHEWHRLHRKSVLTAMISGQTCCGSIDHCELQIEQQKYAKRQEKKSIGGGNGKRKRKR